MSADTGAGRTGDISVLAMNPRLRVLLLVIWVGGASGCATLGSRGTLGVSVVNLAPKQASLFETSADLTVRFTNEATEPVPLAGSAHKLYLNGTYVGRAVTDQRLTIPALGTVTQTVVIHLENLTLLRKAAELSGADAPVVTYRLDSRLHPAEGRLGGLRLSSSGELDLTALANRSPRPRDLATPR